MRSLSLVLFFLGVLLWLGSAEFQLEYTTPLDDFTGGESMVTTSGAAGSSFSSFEEPEVYVPGGEREMLIEWNTTVSGVSLLVNATDGALETYASAANAMAAVTLTYDGTDNDTANAFPGLGEDFTYGFNGAANALSLGIQQFPSTISNSSVLITVTMRGEVDGVMQECSATKSLDNFTLIFDYPVLVFPYPSLTTASGELCDLSFLTNISSVSLRVPILEEPIQYTLFTALYYYCDNGQYAQDLVCVDDCSPNKVVTDGVCNPYRYNIERVADSFSGVSLFFPEVFDSVPFVVAADPTVLGGYKLLGLGFAGPGSEPVLGGVNATEGLLTLATNGTAQAVYLLGNPFNDTSYDLSLNGTADRVLFDFTSATMGNIDRIQVQVTSNTITRPGLCMVDLSPPYVGIKEVTFGDIRAMSACSLENLSFSRVQTLSLLFATNDGFVVTLPPLGTLPPLSVASRDLVSDSDSVMQVRSISLAAQDCEAPQYLYFENSTCVDSCPVRTTPDDVNRVCTPIICASNEYFNETANACASCPDACATCDDTAGCTSCSGNRYLDYNTNTCVLDCPAAYYAYYEDRVCYSCESPCTECQDNSTDCTACEEGTYLLGNTCVNPCPNDTYADDSVNECVSCDTSCLTCNGPAETNCTSCRSGLPLTDDGMCMNCPSGQYRDNATNSCEDCNAACLACDGPSDSECTACANGSYLSEDSCLPSCDEGFFANNATNSCSPCDASCLSCSGPTATDCESCFSFGGFYLLPNDGAGANDTTGSCVTDCQSGAYADPTSSSCLPCEDGCRECEDVSGNCFACNSTLFFDEGSCLVTCPQGFYGNTTTRNCVECAPGCASCTGDLNTQCTSCSSGAFLAGNLCLASCPPRFFANGTSNACEACDGSCATCDGPDATDCVSCASPLFLNESSCATSCPDATFADSATATCRPCFDLCATCTGPAATDCLTCVNGSVFTNGECDPQCDDNQYLSNGVCANCDGSCVTCRGPASTDCTSCSNVTLLQQGSCVTNCSRGFYPSLEDSCLRCDVSCGACDGPSATECTECDGNLFLSASSACVSDCPVGTYAEISNNTCVVCASNCSDCQDAADDCTACSGSLFLDGNLCVPTCSNGTFGDAASNRCLECDDSCLTCSAAGDNACTSCGGADSLSGGVCLSRCPAQFYGASGVCQPCDAPCFTCFGPNANCTACNSGFFLNDLSNACVATCPNGTFADSATSRCLPCADSCGQCDGPMVDNCTACDTGFVLIAGVCEDSCPVGQYFNTASATCRPCDGSCLTCNGATASDCTACSGRLLEDGQCVTACSAGNFAGANGLCLACSSSCATCEGTAVNCTSCPQFTFLRSNNTCSVSCPSNTYRETANRTCVACDASCATCSGSTANDCESCAAPNFLEVLNSTCLATCPNDTFADAASRTCRACYPYCRTCSGPLESNCLTCPPNALLNNGQCVFQCNLNQFPNTTTGACLNCNANCRSCAVSATTCTSCAAGSFLSGSTCVATCPAGTYADTTLNRCVACNQGCQTCTGPTATECLSCPTGFLLDNTTCLDQCGVGKYRSANVCLACSAPCRTCSLSSTNCLSCPAGRYLEGNQCVIACSDGFYLNTTRGTCARCDSSCETCIGPADSQCASCPSISTFNNGRCVVNCPVGQFTQGLACASCSSNCRTCAGSPSTCTSCSTGSYLSGTQCVLTCPAFTYADRTTNTCIRCDSSCDSCDGPSRFDCVSCRSLLFLNSDGRCSSSCPNGTYGTNGRCAACNSACRTCNGATAQECLSCANGLVLENGQCVGSCSTGFVRSPASSVCVPCDESCATCGPSATQCTSCSAPRFLENSQCVISCTGGYRDVTTRTCQSCDGTCATCSGPSATQCVSCPSTRALYDNRCVLECPVGTIESNGVCLDRDCDPNATGYTSTVTSQTRSSPSYTDAGEPELAQVLCAYGDADEACLITGARLEETITTSFSVSATVVCTLGCEDPVTRTFTKRFQATSVVSRNDYRLIAAINPSASNFESVAQTFLTSSEQLQAFYRSADNVFEQDLDQNRRFICDGSRLEDPQVTTLQRRDAVLADVSGSYGSLCSAEPFGELSLSDRRNTRRCVCDGSVASIANPCSQVEINDGAPNAVCHPNQCAETSVAQFIQLILDTPYVSFSDADLGQVITRLNNYMTSNTFPSTGKTVSVIEVSRVDATGQTIIQFYLSNSGGADIANMQQLYRDFVVGRVMVGFPIVLVETSFIISTPVDNGFRVTPSPLPVPVSTPVPVPVPNPVPNPVANPVPVQVAVPVAVPIPRPVANPVPVPVYVPVPVAADDSSAGALSLCLALLISLLAILL